MSQGMIYPASYENVRTAVDRSFELFPLKVAGKRVLVKPNVLRASEAGEGIVTHPAVLRAVVEKLETLDPASIVVGDNPGLFSYGANREIGLILASDNAVALDAVMAFMVGCDPSRLRFLQKAREMGLGDYDLEGIQILGKLERLPDFRLPPLGGEAISGNETIQAFIHGKTLLRPQAYPELCTGCGTCIDQCPVSALTMEDDLPRVKEDTCITCFCCQEICPEKAMVLR